MNKTIKILSIAGTVVLASCSKDRSSVTGWNYNDPKNGGFEVNPYEEQETGPGLVFVEGGTFTMGRAQDDVMDNWNNVPRRVTVSSFYMDETEVRNTDYREYLYWTNRVFGPNYPQVYIKALPDTLVWRNKLRYTDDLVKYYFRHPSYQNYPVVGVNWLQASDFCKWRTDRVNEYILVREGVIDWSPSPSDADYFNTDEYLAGKWAGKVKVPLPDYNPSNNNNGTNAGRNVRIEDGIFLPEYRLPTEAEWEFAAMGLIGNTKYELISQRRIYPWNGHATRNPNDKFIGKELGNFEKSGGDYMGVAGDLNDAGDITMPVFSFWPNDYGLYGMAGNVSEWVMDVYRPLTPEDASDFRPFRGNEYSTQVKDQDGIVIQDSLQFDADSDIISQPGQVKYRPVDMQHKEDNLANRRNYHESDERDFRDGDPLSSIYFSEGESARSDHKALMYETGSTTLISDVARVYKGGSWADRAFWMSPGERRFLDEHQATDYIGFRCAMSRLGNPIGVAKPGGRY